MSESSRPPFLHWPCECTHDGTSCSCGATCVAGEVYQLDGLNVDVTGNDAIQICGVQIQDDKVTAVWMLVYPG